MHRDKRQDRLAPWISLPWNVVPVSVEKSPKSSVVKLMHSFGLALEFGARSLTTTR